VAEVASFTVFAVRHHIWCRTSCCKYTKRHQMWCRTSCKQSQHNSLVFSLSLISLSLSLSSLLIRSHFVSTKCWFQALISSVCFLYYPSPPPIRTCCWQGWHCSQSTYGWGRGDIMSILHTTKNHPCQQMCIFHNPQSADTMGWLRSVGSIKL